METHHFGSGSKIGGVSGRRDTKLVVFIEQLLAISGSATKAEWFSGAVPAAHPQNQTCILFPGIQLNGAFSSAAEALHKPIASTAIAIIWSCGAGALIKCFA